MPGPDPDLRRAWADLGQPDTEGIVVGDVHEPAEGVRLRVGKDRQGRVHFLVPAMGADVPLDRRSRALMLIGQTLEVEGTPEGFADLVCLDPQLEPVFEQLCLDIVGRLAHNASAPVAATTDALAEWRDLLRRAAGGVDRSAVIGLRGELEILREIALADATSALGSWKGPSGGTYDFERQDLLVEAKCTTAQSGSVVQIHGLQQLDPPPTKTLFVWLVHLQSSETDESVSEVVDDLIKIGVPPDSLHEKLELLGCTEEAADDWGEGFRVLKTALWEVTQTFPGIRASRISPEDLAGVVELTYALDLDAAGPPLGQDARSEVVRRLAAQ